MIFREYCGLVIGEYYVVVVCIVFTFHGPSSLRTEFFEICFVKIKNRFLYVFLYFASSVLSVILSWCIVLYSEK